MSTGWGNIAITEPRVQHGIPSELVQVKSDLPLQHYFTRWSYWAVRWFWNMGRPHGSNKNFSLPLPWEARTQQKWHHVAFRGWVIKGLKASSIPWPRAQARSLSCPERGHLNVLRWQMLLSPGSQPLSPRCQTRLHGTSVPPRAAYRTEGWPSLSCLNFWPTKLWDITKLLPLKSYYVLR